MRKLLLVSLSAFIGSLLAVLLLGLPLRVRAGGARTATQNGDVNGDLRLDISDPIYVLRFLFSDGPAPVACADSPELVARVGALEDTNKRIADALEELVNPCRKRPDRFVDNQDGTVTDECTRLMWQKKPEKNGTWDAAVQYVDGLRLAGHDDWRLPTLVEIDGILLGGKASPDLPPVFGINADLLWSAHVSAAVPTFAWAASLAGLAGPVFLPRDKGSESSSANVLAVRGP